MPAARPQVPLLASGQLDAPASLGFDGLVHARLSFDRHALRRMQAAIEAASAQQLQQHAVWLPPGEAAPPALPASQQKQSTQPGDGATPAAADGPPVSAQALERLRLLQPEADAVAQFSASMRERGGQRLNAEQRNAVAAAVCGGGRAYPYALFGPPGALQGRWGR